MTTEDKREFVRMDVQIPFLYRIVRKEEADQIKCPSFPDYSYFTDYIAGELEHLDEVISRKVSDLNEEFPQIAEVFRLLEQKWKLIVSALTRSSKTRKFLCDGSTSVALGLGFLPMWIYPHQIK